MGYMGYWNVRFLKFPLLLEIPYGTPGAPKLLLSYDLDLKSYCLIFGEQATAHQHLINMEVSPDLCTNSDYLLELLRLHSVVCKSKSIKQILGVLRMIGNMVPSQLSSGSTKVHLDEFEGIEV